VVAVLIKLPSFMTLLDSAEQQPKRRQARATIKDLYEAINYFHVDWNRFPIPTSAPSDQDISMRSQGPMLPLLIGDDTKPHIPLPSSSSKDVRYIDLPKAQDHKSGIWQDGGEWILSDPWGEPYYITLDTNKNGKVANPEPRGENIPAMFATAIILYSSGPDRDPKTWQDNVCSWRTR